MNSWAMLPITFMLFSVCCVSSANRGRGALLPPNVGKELVIASFHGDVSKVKALLLEGADVDVSFASSGELLTFPDGGYPADPEGWTALHAASAGGQVAIMQLLLEHGAKVNAVDQYGVTALLLLVTNSAKVHQNEIEAGVRLLLKFGAEPSLQQEVAYYHDVAKQTPLHRAVRGRMYTVVQLLVEAGADLHVKDARGRKPVDIALANRDAELAEYLLNAESRR